MCCIEVNKILYNTDSIRNRMFYKQEGEINLFQTMAARIGAFTHRKPSEKGFYSYFLISREGRENQEERVKPAPTNHSFFANQSSNKINFL